jgi:hypothetical protein
MQIINKMFLSLGMEIKAQDLRFGNLIRESKTSTIYTNSGTLLKGCYVSKAMQFGDYFLRYEELEPIQLTEEWLLKLGFTKCLFIDFQFDSPHENDYRICIYDDRFIFRGLGASIVEIKTIHQLQNLYHSLTGQELTIK